MYLLPLGNIVDAVQAGMLKPASDVLALDLHALPGIVAVAWLKIIAHPTDLTSVARIAIMGNVKEGGQLLGLVSELMSAWRCWHVEARRSCGNIRKLGVYLMYCI